MKTKIKYNQYLVRGKHHRQYHILKLPTPEYAWLYEAPPEDGEVALDGDETVFREIGIAMSLLMVNPTKIIYLPKAKNKNCYFRRRELVITRQELQLRRSEWVALRRQISRRTRIENYVYDYDEEKVLDKYDKHIKPYWYDWDEEKNVREILGDTAFWTLSESSCLYGFYDTVTSAKEERTEYSTFTHMGWILTERGLYDVTHSDEPEEMKL